MYVIDFLQTISGNAEEFVSEELRQRPGEAVWTIEEK